jgi:NADH-quinone oxidoreductase subunit N
MTAADLVALLPLLILGAGPVVIMLVVAFYRNHQLILLLTLLALALAFLSLPLAASEAPRQVTALLILDRYALFYMGLLIAASFTVALLAHAYLESRPGQHEEFYLLILLATVGSAILVASSHFASFFLGLEILSISLYTLMAYPRAWAHGVEAGIKYLILAAGSSAFLLFGMALIYAEQGSLAFASLASRSAASPGVNGLILMAGVGLLTVGIGFKLAVVPFHLWTPDVYEGAPAPVTGFVATLSKGAVFALLLRLFARVDVRAHGSVFLLFLVIAIASMLFGNLLALLQNNVKRILAYSSIAHLGYLLVAFLASGVWALTAATFYLVAYFVATLAAFGVVTVLSAGERDADTLAEYRGLFWQHPWLAGVFTAALLSLAGIPLTAGFVGKFYLLAAGASNALWLAVLVLVGTSTIGLYYYLRIIVAMAVQPEAGGGAASLAPSLSLMGGVALAVLTLLLVWLGVYPAPLVHLIQTVASGLA